MNQNDIHELVEKQRAYFYSNETLNIEKRIHALKKLKTCIQKNEAEIATALEADLGKSNFESYMCETGLVLSEISYMLKHIRRFSREKRVHTPLSQFHAKINIIKCNHKLFVKTTHSFKIFDFHKHACRRYRTDFLNIYGSSEISFVFA